MSSTNDARSYEATEIAIPDRDEPISRRGWGRGLLLGATALGVLFASGKPQEAEASAPSDTWKLGGNADVSSDSTNFIGPTNSAPLIFKTAGVERMRVHSSGNIGIGVATPSARLQIEVANGIAVLAKHTATSGDAAAIRGETSATVANASAVHGIVKSTAPGADSAGVRGENNATTANGAGVSGGHAGFGNGVFGSSSRGNGVYGTGAYGVYGVGSYGVYGIGTYGVSGFGYYAVYGDADTSGYGVYGKGHVGVCGEGAANFGVYGTTGGDVPAIYGVGGTYAVKGENGTLGGVQGVAPYAGVRGLGGSYGVIGETSSTGIGAVGVYGGAQSNQWAGYFSGNVSITGSISKASGSFRIDHPLDPTNKYLYHSFVESPDMKNIYDGVVLLDARGEATVTMPDWFEALNIEFRYQLTCIGGYAPVYIAAEIEHNQFTIAGGRAGLKVSWMVTGIRQDAFANANRIPVEEQKSAADRGTYLHPEAFGKPATMGVTRLQPTSSPDTQAPLPKRPTPEQGTTPIKP